MVDHGGMQSRRTAECMPVIARQQDDLSLSDLDRAFTVQLQEQASGDQIMVRNDLRRCRAERCAVLGTYL
jgi:hypothetical protein